jgi:hypothetical protein
VVKLCGKLNGLKLKFLLQFKNINTNKNKNKNENVELETNK